MTTLVRGSSETGIFDIANNLGLCGWVIVLTISGAAQRLPYLSRVDDLVPSKKRFSEKMTSKLTIWCNLKRFLGTKRKIWKRLCMLKRFCGTKYHNPKSGVL